jgi:hypothetical protein
MDPPADVASSESLARFVFRSKDVRADSTLRPDVFIPFPYPDLSVTRHFGLEDGEIWEKGHAIGRERSLPLIGRGDVVAEEFLKRQLTVRPAPVSGNQHHANVTGWPLSKAAQKNLAQEISAVARFISAPSL